LRVYVGDEEADVGSVELDWKDGRDRAVREIQVVARTAMRDVRVLLDFVQFERQTPSDVIQG
jgi:hypothetical protein